MSKIKDVKGKTTESFIDQWIENLDITSENFKKVLEKGADFLIKPITINDKEDVKVYMSYIDGMINHEYISDFILKPLVNDVRLITAKDEKSLYDYIEEGVIYFSAQKSFDSMRDVVDAVLSGNVVLIFDGLKKAIGFDTKGFQMRGITPPTEETSIKGSKDTFVETIRVNTATIRRKMKSSSLAIEEMTVGTVSNTIISIIYVEHLVNKSSLRDLKERLEDIQAEEVFYTGIIEDWVIENKFANFPQVGYTEKPDRFCSSIMDGKIGIIIDGIPFTLIMPVTIVDFFQATDDYSNFQFISSFYRGLRYLLASFALLLNGFFIAITTFHQQLLPAPLAASIIKSREGVPFPLFFEIMILVLAFQTLIEAGTRIYSSIGSMVTLVGGLVVGEAAVSAKFVSPAAVVVVAIASIASYAIPNRDFANSIWLWQFVIILLSSIIGLYGLTLGVILLIYTMSSIEVLGVPYLSPFVSNEDDVYKDTLTRPLLYKKESPSYIQRTK